VRIMNSHNIYWDYQNQAIVKSLTDGRQANLIVYATNQFPVSVALISRETNAVAYTAEQYVAGDALMIAGRAALTDSNYIFSNLDLAYNNDDDEPRYEGTVDLDTGAALNALGTKDRVYFWCEIAIMRGTNYYFATAFKALLKRAVITDSVAVAPAAGTRYGSNGQLQMYSNETGKWHDVSLSGPTGEVGMDIDQTGET
jgi:hypothetical protein